MAAPIGIFDSGLGGLSILRQLRAAMPGSDFIFLADNANFPFGEKTNQEVVELTGRGIERLAGLGCQVIVLACNTAATTSLEKYQQLYPHLIIDGVTPLLEQALAATKTGIIAVYATHATLESEHFKQQLAATPPGIEVLTEASYDWVRSVEAGNFSPASVATTVGFDVSEGADVVVLGCTHFAFLEAAVRAAAGPDVTILQPGPEIAQRVMQRVTRSEGGSVKYLLSAESPLFAELATRLVGELVTTEIIS